MSGRQSRRARAAAHSEAVRTGLWGKGRSSLKWWRIFLAKVFPRLRKRYDGWIGRWYKATIKRMAAAYRARIHDREYQAFMRARAAMKR